MKIRIGYEMVFGCTQPTPMILTLNVHSSMAPRLLTPDQIGAFRDRLGLDESTEWDRFQPDSPAGRLCSSVGGDINKDLAVLRVEAPRGSLNPVERGNSGELIVTAGSRVEYLVVGGGGGGRPTMAHAGGRDPDRLPEALDRVPGLVKASLAD